MYPLITSENHRTTVTLEKIILFCKGGEMPGFLCDFWWLSSLMSVPGWLHLQHRELTHSLHKAYTKQQCQCSQQTPCIPRKGPRPRFHHPRGEFCCTAGFVLAGSEHKPEPAQCPNPHHTWLTCRTDPVPCINPVGMVTKSLFVRQTHLLHKEITARQQYHVPS